jgi:arylsulfatase A-like enzyme
VALGLCGGYLDVAFIVFKRFLWNEEGYYRNAADFPWTVPLGHLALMLPLAVTLVLVGRFRPRPFALQTSLWCLATLALWGALLRLPLYGGCSLIFAMGLSRPISRWICREIAARGRWSRRLQYGFIGIVGLLAPLAGLSSGLPALKEAIARATLPPTPSTARNAILIVWDTVRALNTSMNGYPRDTTPNLARWATKGVTYKSAVSPAPWTYPSHASFLTGQWPCQLNSQWKLKLDTPEPTLSEYLASRGYQTAGFISNTNCCSYESRLSRGFAHYEDYALTPISLLTRTVPGHWLATNVLYFTSYYDKKWINIQSRGADKINNAFLGWLDKRRTDRPFFAFLNFFDAHEPYVPPWGYSGRFGVAPFTHWDFQFLHDYVGLPKTLLKRHYLDMAIDCYDDCIAYLDGELGRLLDQLAARGLLDSTDVIVTSDHGESFGDHNIIGHGYTVNLEEVGVPLVILSSSAPAGRTVNDAVSLRDLPATIVHLLGLSADSPLPGRTLTAYWNAEPDASVGDRTSPAFSERLDAKTFPSHTLDGLPELPAISMSLIASGCHYIRDIRGTERLFNLVADRYEDFNLVESPTSANQLKRYRRLLLDVLTASPGSREVEDAYLEQYREHLRQDLVDHSPPQVALSR